jgi:Tfp pilus assembly protein PilF
MGVRDLQRADARKAVEQLKEAINLDPQDEALRRTYLFAQTYQERPKDLLYRIYVKYLPFRG